MRRGFYVLVVLVVVAAPTLAPGAPSSPRFLRLGWDRGWMQLAPAPDAPPTKPQAAQPQNSQPHSPLPTLQATANLVNLYFVARNQHGALVPHLAQADCTVFEDGAQQTLKNFAAQTRLPLTLGILLDTSASQQRVLPVEQQTAAAFLQHILRSPDGMPSQDEAFLLSFDVTVDMLADLTGSARELQHAMERAEINSNTSHYANGTIPSIGKPRGTLLYDAIYLAAQDKLQQESGRKAIILLTDGQDAGSQEKFQSAVEAAHKANAIVYVLLITDPGLYGMLDFSGAGAMRKLAEATGGRVFQIGDNGRKMQAAFDEIESELRTQYQVSYIPGNHIMNGSYRRVQVKCQQNGKPLRVQARQGYYAIAP